MAFPHQVAVVTGASSGIGWELARTLARQGCAVGLLARRRDRLEALAAEIQSAGGRAAVAVADVADRAATLVAVDALRERLGPIDLLIANSGVGIPTHLPPMNVAEVEQMIRVNLFGVIYAIEAVLPAMLERGRGHLAAISSQAAYKGLPGESGYCASKAAVNAYMEGLRIQLRKRGITVTTVCPGFVATPMIEKDPYPQPWVMSADAAARRIVRALERKVKVYNFPWQMSLLMALTRWMPDWMVARAISSSAEGHRST